MVVSKKIKDLFVITGADFIANLIQGIFWIFLAFYLEKINYGELGFLFGLINISMTVSLLGLSNAVVVFERKNENIFPAALLLVFISSIVSAVIISIITMNFFVGILIVGFTLFILLQKGLTSQKRFRDYSKHRLIRIVLAILLSLALYQVLGINGIILGFFISTLIVLKEIKSLTRGRQIDFHIIRSKKNFIVTSFVNRLSTSLMWWGDKILIGIFFSFQILAEYQIATQYLFLVHSIPLALNKFLLPLESENQKNKRIKILSIIFSSIITIISVFTLPILISNFLPQYEESIDAIIILSFCLVPLTIYAIQNSEFIGSEKNRKLLVSNLIQIISYLLLIIPLGNIFGLVGFAYALLVSSIFSVVANVLLKRFMN